MTRSPEKSSASPAEGGILFLDKPAGQTSFQALGRVKRVLGTRKVGHTGTLDKFAEGLLILLTGKFTRLNALITGMDKEYVALVRFGRETDTLDPEGETVAEAAVPSLEAIEKALEGFTGEIDQIPPLYSAVHVDGQRAHKIARRGESVEMPSRRIRIDELEILEWDAPDLRLRVRCSKGTYIRSLARDLGLAAGSRAYVQELRRTMVGEYSVEQALSPEAFTGPADFVPWELFFDSLEGVGTAELSPEGLERIPHGVPFRPAFLKAPLQEKPELLLLKDGEGRLKAVAEKDEKGKYRYKINLSVS